MIRPPRTDMWRCGIVPAPIREAADPARLAALRHRIVWLPDPGQWRYLADPFALWRGDVLHVFVEAFDYRTRLGVIECHQFDRALAWRESRVVLARHFHLSYPLLIEEDREVFMVPEGSRAGELALYRARRFPDDWVRETVLLPGVPAVDATPVRHEGRWWMFFALAGERGCAQRELHAAFADALVGPWSLHPSNPVLVDRKRTRPGGTPFRADDGRLVLPVQDCGGTYGGALRFLTFSVLTPIEVRIEAANPADDPALTGDLVSDTYREGFHTLSACGDLSLIDVKRIEHAWSRHGVNLQRAARRFFGRR